MLSVWRQNPINDWTSNPGERECVHVRGWAYCTALPRVRVFFCWWWHGQADALPSLLISCRACQGRSQCSTERHSNAVWALVSEPYSLLYMYSKCIGASESSETTSDHTFIVVIYPLCSYAPPTTDRQQAFPLHLSILPSYSRVASIHVWTCCHTVLLIGLIYVGLYIILHSIFNQVYIYFNSKARSLFTYQFSNGIDSCNDIDPENLIKNWYTGLEVTR